MKHKPLNLVSIHGGHSGTYCNHAADCLEEVVAAYAAQRFDWVGITEHMPPVDDQFLFPEEHEAGLNAEAMARRFDRYMARVRQLQAQYRGRLALAVGFETDAYRGALSLAQTLVQHYRPDYIVGSVHHVNDICIDFTETLYQAAIAACGSLEELYCRYFDLQFELIETLKPAVVGHFDLVRIFDPDYRHTLESPAVSARIRRNLALMAAEGLILDVNTNALAKGADEPYVSRSILLQARDMGIKAAPGDDSHGVARAGDRIAATMGLLDRLGFEIGVPQF